MGSQVPRSGLYYLDLAMGSTSTMATNEPAARGGTSLRRIRNGNAGCDVVCGGRRLLGVAASCTFSGATRRSYVAVLAGVVLLAGAHIRVHLPRGGLANRSSGPGVAASVLHSIRSRLRHAV